MNDETKRMIIQTYGNARKKDRKKQRKGHGKFDTARNHWAGLKAVYKLAEKANA